MLAEVLLIVFVYGVGVLVVWRQYLALDAATWYATPSGEGVELSLAGMWFVYVSLPVFQFLLCRWYFRLLIWARFLWQVSRIPLSLVPTHPDRVGGLGFLANTAYAFTAARRGARRAAGRTIATRIFFLGAALTDFKVEIAAGRLSCWWRSSALCSSLRRSLRRQNARACANTGRSPSATCASSMPNGCAAARTAGEPLVGSADIQSLADLGNSFEVVEAHAARAGYEGCRSAGSERRRSFRSRRCCSP